MKGKKNVKAEGFKPGAVYELNDEDELLYGGDQTPASMASIMLAEQSKNPGVPRRISRWWKKYLVEVKPTYWLFVLRLNGNLEIYSLPEMRLSFLVRDACAGKRILADSLESVPIPSGGIEDEELSSGGQNTDADKCRELLVVGVGHKGTRVLMLMRCEDQLMIYQCVSALLVSLTAGEDAQWTPYNNLLQQYQQAASNLQQAASQQDQQYQASDFGGSFDFGGHGGGGSHDFGGGSHDFGSSSSGGDFGGGDYGGHNLQSHVYPVHQHVEEENPEPIKHYKEVVVPLPKNVEFKVNQPIIIPVPHPIPIKVPVPKAVVIPIIKEVNIPVEKSVPYPVERIVHVPKIKEVPFQVVKHVLVAVEKPVPFKVPVYETIIHTKKGGHH